MKVFPWIDETSHVCDEIRASLEDKRIAYEFDLDAAWENTPKLRKRFSQPIPPSGEDHYKQPTTQEIVNILEYVRLGGRIPRDPRLAKVTGYVTNNETLIRQYVEWLRAWKDAILTCQHMYNEHRRGDAVQVQRLTNYLAENGVEYDEKLAKLDFVWAMDRTLDSQFVRELARRKTSSRKAKNARQRRKSSDLRETNRRRDRQDADDYATNMFNPGNPIGFTNPSSPFSLY